MGWFGLGSNHKDGALDIVDYLKDGERKLSDFPSDVYKLGAVIELLGNYSFTEQDIDDAYNILLHEENICDNFERQLYLFIEKDELNYYKETGKRLEYKVKKFSDEFLKLPLIEQVSNYKFILKHGLMHKDLLLGYVTYLGRHYDYVTEGTFFLLNSFYEKEWVNSIKWSKKVKVKIEATSYCLKFYHKEKLIVQMSESGLEIFNEGLFLI